MHGDRFFRFDIRTCVRAALGRGACGAVPGRNTGARGGMLNGRACRRARQRIAARPRLAYARIGLASGQPPQTDNGGTPQQTRERSASAPNPRNPIKPEPRSNHAGIPVKCSRNRRQVRKNPQPVRRATALRRRSIEGHGLRRQRLVAPPAPWRRKGASKRGRPVQIGSISVARSPRGTSSTRTVTRCPVCRSPGPGRNRVLDFDRGISRRTGQRATHVAKHRITLRTGAHG